VLAAASRTISTTSWRNFRIYRPRQRRNKDAKIARYLAKALGTMDRARRLTQQLLTFSKAAACQENRRFFPFVYDTALFALSVRTCRAGSTRRRDLRDRQLDRNQIWPGLDIIINASRPCRRGRMKFPQERSFIHNELPVWPPATTCVYLFRIRHRNPQEIHPEFRPVFHHKEKRHGSDYRRVTLLQPTRSCITVESEPGKGACLSVFTRGRDKARTHMKSKRFAQHGQRNE